MRGWAVGCAVLTVSTVLAGCIGGADERTGAVGQAGLAEDTLYGLKELLDVRIPLPDGVNVHGTIYLPDVPAGQKVPVIMDLGPYYGNLGAETYVYNTEYPPSLLYHHFLQRGYAVAFVSLRGTGLSEGCFKIGGAEEQRDAAVIVEWLAGQEWSDGNVAMTGVSYDGTTPWEAAVTGTPALKAIVPVEGISDMYRYMFFEGVPAWSGGGVFFNAYYTQYVDVEYGWERGDMNGIGAWAAAQASNLCTETADVVLAPVRTWQDGVHGPFWDERDTSAMMDRIQAATLVVHGFQDWNVKPDHVQFLWESLPEPKRMLLGQWQHNIPWSNSLNRDLNYPAYNGTVTEWFDAFVRNDPAARERALAAASVRAQDTLGRWWNLTEWPPAESEPLPLHLGREGRRARLMTVPENESMTYSFRAQPWTNRAADAQALYVDAWGTATSTALAGATSVSFESHTVHEPLHLMGNPEVDVTVSVDRPGAYLNAWLYDVAPTGHLALVTPGFLNLANRDSRDTATPVPTGQEMAVTVKMFAINHVLQPGHRLRVVFESSDPSSGYYVNLPQKEPTTLTLHIGEGNDSLLRLPVFAGALPESPPRSSGIGT